MGLLALPGPVTGLGAYEGATAAAEQRAPQSAGEATTCLPSETEKSRLVDEGIVTRDRRARRDLRICTDSCQTCSQRS